MKKQMSLILLSLVLSSCDPAADEGMYSLHIINETEELVYVRVQVPAVDENLEGFITGFHEFSYFPDYRSIDWRGPESADYFNPGDIVFNMDITINNEAMKKITVYRRDMEEPEKSIALIYKYRITGELLGSLFGWP